MSKAEPSTSGTGPAPGPAALGAVRDSAPSKARSVPPVQDTAEWLTLPQVKPQQGSGQQMTGPEVTVPDVMVPQVSVQLNGEAQRVPPGLNLEALLRYLGHQPRLVVVEYNGAILPRALWADQRVGESDVLEVVTIVGGGS